MRSVGILRFIMSADHLDPHLQNNSERLPVRPYSGLKVSRDR